MLISGSMTRSVIPALLAALALLPAAGVAVLPTGSMAQTEAADDPVSIIQPVTDQTLEDFLWIARPLVVFADNPADPRYVQQMQLITQRLDALADRDVVVLTDTDPSARSAIRLELRPRGFALNLIAKDGTVLLRKPAPWDVREISRSIDKQPLRQQEVRDRRDANAPMTQ